jgi:hypothetical protein
VRGEDNATASLGMGIGGAQRWTTTQIPAQTALPVAVMSEEPHTPGSARCVGAGARGHTAQAEITTKRLLIALLAVDAAGGAVAIKHRVAGEPFGIGGSLDVRNPAVVMLWGTALSAPITSLALATALYRHRPAALRVLGALFAIGALSEPAFWGRRLCPRLGRMLLTAHLVIAMALAVDGLRN